VIAFVSSRKRKKAEKALEAEQLAANEPAPEIAAPSGNYDDFTKSAEEAANFLKTSGVDIYSLPWYLVAGTPKAGKTSLVMSSGLNFQTLPSQRQSEFGIIRPTRGVDWRMTSEAVFIDSSGRYQNENADTDEWTGIIETIKKYRGQRPLDGFILTVSAERILTADESEIEQIAKTLRTRLDEVITRTKTRFPVYLVFTHADSIEGFRDSFSVSQKDHQNLVWGSTIPLENSDKAGSMFDGEYEILANSVMKRRIVRLSAPFPSHRQLKIFNFPLHFGSSRKNIGHFVSTLFRPNPFSEMPFLRGFYFTASPIQKNQTVGESYFAKKLFRDVILRDKDLVKNFIAQRQSPPILGWLITALGTLLVSAFLLMSGISLYKNKQLVDAAADRGEKVLTIYKADQGRDLFKKTPDEVRAEIGTIDELRASLQQLDDFERNSPPIWMRFGLYSGNSMREKLFRDIYASAVEQRFKKPVIAKLEQDLQKFAANNGTETTENLEKYFNSLSAYLMLSDGQTKKGESYRKFTQGDFVAKALLDYWKTEPKLPAGYEEVAKQNLDFYAKQIDRDEFPRIKVDQNLVNLSRKKLQAYPAYLRYYHKEVNRISKTVEQSFGSSTVASILTAKSGNSDFIEGNYQVPSAFTLEGYKMMKVSIRDADAEMIKDDWVMDEEAKKDLIQATDAANVETRYFKDYADHWKSFVKGINIDPYDKENGARALGSFTNKNSPLDILLVEINRQTFISAKPKPITWLDTAKDWVGMLERLETRDNLAPEVEFRPLQRFIGDADKIETAPIATYKKALSSVFNKFSPISQDSSEFATLAKMSPEDQDKKIGLRNADTSVQSLLASFDTPSAQEVADLLKEPLGNLKSLLGSDATSQLGKTWTTEILSKAKEAEKGFPFDDSGEADLAKLTAYLNPANGTLSDFYTKRLEKYFEKDTGGKLKLKDSSELKFSDEFVAYLNNAFALREALFGSNKEANFEYDFRLNPIKESIIEVTIDGQKITSEGTASSKLKFPAGTNAETGVFMNFTSTAEGSSTSGKPIANTNANTSANSANSSVNTSSNMNSAPVSKFQSANKPANKPANSTPSGATSIKRPGTWGLFMFFADGNPKPSPSGGGYELSYTLGGKKITATIKPTGGDLFNRSLFKNVKAPEKLLK
jgi:type VI secretion system protein ImpL